MSEPRGKTIEIYSVAEGKLVPAEPLEMPESEWRGRLAPEEFQVLRQQGTERAFTGRYWDQHDEGVYRCAGCGTDLFLSATKFESGT
ncbi:MAG: peptide-methionine (R)-S-oxide reductase, partial [Thermoanaerobaculia bacterium]